MNILSRTVLSLLIGRVLLVYAESQVTLTASDVSAYLAPGNTYVTRIDTATKTANMGSLGATSWDFSALVNNFSSSSTTVLPDTTAFSGLFPSATHALRAGGNYSYYTVGTDFQFLGTAASAPFQIRTNNVPPQVLNQLPMTFGTTWTSSFVDSSITVIGGTPFVSASNVVVSNTVDEYGNLTLPGGGVYQALRMKTDRQSTTNGHTARSIVYQFLAKNGANVTVVAADTSQPTTGVINVSSSSWNGPVGITGVKEIVDASVPSSFVLKQNYPNPFNPTTTMRYELPEDSRVTVKIYNLFGQVVATLADGHQSAGYKTVSWDGSSFASGVYFCKLEAVPTANPGKAFAQAKAMMLIK